MADVHKMWLSTLYYNYSCTINMQHTTQRHLHRN